MRSGSCNGGCRSAPRSQATKLGRLRGTLPVIVSAARPDPLVISLDDCSGANPITTREMTLRFRIMAGFGESKCKSR